MGLADVHDETVEGTKTRLDSEAAPWLLDPTFRKIGEGVFFLGEATAVVGGAVRDALLGNSFAADLDLVASVDPEVGRFLLKKAGFKAAAHPYRGDTFFVERVDNPGIAHDVSASFVGTGGFQRLKEDALRRDFSVNAILCAPDGALTDPAGGMADLEARRVRALPGFADDPVRAIRYFRMRELIGETEPHGTTFDAVSAVAEAARRQEPIRLGREILKLLEAAEPEALLPHLRLMEQSGVLEAVLPGADVDRFERFVRRIDDPRAFMFRRYGFSLLAILGAAEVGGRFSWLSPADFGGSYPSRIVLEHVRAMNEGYVAAIGGPPEQDAAFLREIALGQPASPPPSP